MRKPLKPDNCELCDRPKPLSFHHLIPRKNHSKRRFRRSYDRMELKTNGIWLCRLCHRQVHRFYSEDELAAQLGSRAGSRGVMFVRMLMVMSLL